MLKATKDALEASIKSWEMHVDAGGFSNEAPHCALCDRFDVSERRCIRSGEKWGEVEKCPIYEKTGKSGCHGTVFYDNGYHQERADEMLRFLKDLR